MGMCSDNNDNLGLQTKLYSMLTSFSHISIYQFSNLFNLKGIYWCVKA